MFRLNQSPLKTLKLISLDKYLAEMIKQYETNCFPKVLLLDGKKGIGKFTLIFHFLNYIYTKEEKNNYNITEKLININSKFYKSILNQTCSDVVFFQAEEGKNIKIDDVRKLKSVLSRSSLSTNPRFTIIDEVEFLNANSSNALLKTLEEPSVNNYFILINNQQAELIDTISSRCIKSYIHLNFQQQKKVIDHFIKNKIIESLIDISKDLTPGLLLKYTELGIKYKINNNDNILINLDKLLHSYKKDKDKNLINMLLFFIDQFFYNQIKKNLHKTDILMNLKLTIIHKINDFIVYNLHIRSVLNSIEFNLKNVR